MAESQQEEVARMVAEIEEDWKQAIDFVIMKRSPLDAPRELQGLRRLEREEG